MKLDPHDFQNQLKAMGVEDNDAFIEGLQDRIKKNQVLISNHQNQLQKETKASDRQKILESIRDLEDLNRQMSELIAGT